MKSLASLRDMWIGPDLDSQFRTSYRKILFGQYRSLDNTAAKTQADQIVDMEPADVDWDELYQLELLMIKLEPEASMRRRAWNLRNEYKEVVSPQEYADYLASNPPPANTGDAVSLRADLIRLQEELNWRYVVIWMLEAYRSLILRRLVMGTLCVLAIAVLLIYWGESVALIGAWTNISLPILTCILVPGIVGGLISTVRRIQATRFGNNADLDLSQLEQGNTSIYLSPFLGGIFALILFFIFASGLAAGALFPTITIDTLLVSGVEILEMKEIAKLMLWCFLAGFAEKLVPDRLERLAQAGTQQSSVASSSTVVINRGLDGSPDEGAPNGPPAASAKRIIP